MIWLSDSSSLTHFCIGEGEQKGVIYNQVFSSFDKGVAIHVGERNIFCLTSPLIIIFQAEFLKLQLSPTISTLDTHTCTQWSISWWMLSIWLTLWQFFTKAWKKLILCIFQIFFNAFQLKFVTIMVFAGKYAAS